MNTRIQNLSNNMYAQMLAQSALTPAERKVEPRVYYHRHNYAKFIFDHRDAQGNCIPKAVSFANYRYVTDDKYEQDQLDMVADVPGTFIYTIPDSEVDRAMQLELAGEMHKDLLRAAAAGSAANNLPFDPNAPIVPVNVQQVGSTPIQVQQMVAPAAVVGLQNSMSGSQVTQQLTTGTPQAPVVQASPNAEAMAKLQALTEQAKQKQEQAAK